MVQLETKIASFSGWPTNILAFTALRRRGQGRGSVLRHRHRRHRPHPGPSFDHTRSMVLSAKNESSSERLAEPIGSIRRKQHESDASEPERSDRF